MNIFTNLLSSLNIKYTKSYSNSYFEEHPYKYNMLGLSIMLNEYKIANKGIQVKDKKDAITELEAPYIAHLGNDFVNVYKTTKDGIFYIWNDIDIKNSYDDFIERWDGIALLVETDENSIEPNYKENKKKELWNLGLQIILGCSITIILLFNYFNQRSYNSIGINLLILLNCIGAYIGYLLTTKQLKSYSKYADKLCSLFKKSDCNNVLESDAANLWGIINWSEVGLSYFISNLFILFFIPQYVTYIALTNIITIPYSLWSIWYQGIKVKQWCPLCLLVQALFWAIFITDLFYGYISASAILLNEVTYIITIYVTPFVCIHLIIPIISDLNKKKHISYELESLKMKEGIFTTLLKAQRKYDISKSTSQIVFGNPNANLKITIFSNPHCEPCGKMHKRLCLLQKRLKEKVCIQYIFSSFSENLYSSNKFLIAAYLNNNIEDAEKIYNSWFSGGKYLREEFINKYQYDIDTTAIKEEFMSHEEWKKETGLRATPTILINGYELPNAYKIEDIFFLKYMC